jgi:hypothetical protein
MTKRPKKDDLAVALGLTPRLDRLSLVPNGLTETAI